MPRAETRIYNGLPTATEKQHGKTQIFHGLPVPIQRPSLTVADFAHVEKGPKTRLMPIEELLRPPTKGATSATGGWQSRLHLKPIPRARKLRLVAGLIAIVVAAYSQQSDVRASTPPVVAAVPVITPAPTPVEEAKEPPRKPKRVSPSKSATPRKAGDQLAAGELARAAKTYEQLAAAAPEHPVYAEAARILRQRIERPTP